MELALNQIDNIIVKDLRINFDKIRNKDSLTSTEFYLICLAGAKLLNYQDLFLKSKEALKDLSEAELNEAELSVGIVSMLNSYYKTKNLLQEDFELGPAELRMQSLFNPVLGKRMFEILSLAISILNYCPYCVKAHAKECVKHGLTPEQIHDIIRLSSIINGMAKIG